MKADNDMIRIADIYDRFSEHIKLYDKPVRDDKQIWRWVDEMNEQQLSDIVTFAMNNQYFNHDLREWLIEVSERSPFYVRTKSDQRKTSKNNTMMWKMLMLMRESIQYQLKDEQDPRNRLFEM